MTSSSIGFQLISLNLKLKKKKSKEERRKKENIMSYFGLTTIQVGMLYSNLRLNYIDLGFVLRRHDMEHGEEDNGK